MICPYCGKEMDNDYTKEHFFPQSIRSNAWDFYACKKCNHRKNNHIVYPTQNLFEVAPAEFNRKKFVNLWETAGWRKYTALVPWMQMRSIFRGDGSYYSERVYTLEEQQLFEFDYVRSVIELGEEWVFGCKEVQALVLLWNSPTILLLHNYNENFTLPMRHLQVMKVSDYIQTKLYGIRVVGTGENGVWRNTYSNVDFFKKVMRY